MQQADVPTADARIFEPTDAERRLRSRPREFEDSQVIRGFDKAREYILTRDEPLVVKAAGLAKGKGVFMCLEPAEALRIAEKLMVERVLGEAGETIVVEERLN